MTSSVGLLTDSYGLGWAPGGLSVAQELVNSGLPTAPDRDPLTSLDTAVPWLQTLVAQWAERTGQRQPSTAVTDRDLPHLRGTRSALREWLTGQEPSRGRPAAVTVTLAGDRGLGYAPGGSGAAAVQSLVAVELLLADRQDTARRLKVCANPDCGAAFYDGSPNNSRRWHDVKTCGNVANLRASRQRRSARASSGVGDGSTERA